MVTASDGRPKPVMNKPLTAPNAAPSSRLIAISAGSELTPLTHSWPITVQVSPSTLATDKSISPVMTMSVIGRAISAIGMASSVTKRQKRGLATPSMVNAPTMDTTTSAISMTASHEPRTPRTRAARSGMVRLPFSQAARDAGGKRPVQADRGEDQRTDRGVLPERVDTEHRQGGPDCGQQHRSQGCAVDRAAAAEDGDPADHHC